MSQDYAKLECLPSHILPDTIDLMPIPMICFDSHLEALYFNFAFSSYVEIDNAQATALSCMGTLSAMDIMPEVQPNGEYSTDALMKYAQESIQKGFVQVPWELQTLNGNVINTQVSIVTFQGLENLYICCYFLNIIAMEKKQPEIQPVQKPTPTKKKFLYEPSIDKKFEQDLLEAIPLAMHIWSKNLELMECSAEVTSMFQLASKDEFKEKYFTLCPDVQLGKPSESLMKEYMQKALDEGFCKFKWLHEDTKGKLIPCEVTFCRINHNGEECILGYTQDLSVVSSHVQEFVKVQESTRAMLDAAPMAINLWDKDYHLRDANLECVRLFGFENIDDFLSNVKSLLPETQDNGRDSGEFIKEALQRAFLEGYYRSDMNLYHSKTKELIPVEVTLVRLTIWNEEVVIAYIRDLRDFKAIINKIQSAEERIQTIFDITPLGINVWDKEFQLIECNEAIVNLYGFASKAAYIPARYKVIPRTQPDGSKTFPLARNAIQEAFDKGHSRIEMLTADMHSNPIPVEIISKRAYVQSQEVVISYVRDLRELKAMLAELDAVAQELRTARDIAEQSVQTKNEFLSNMSHELLTPLNGVLGLLHLLNTTALQSAQREYVRKSIFSADRLLQTVKNVLDFSKIDAGTFELKAAAFTLRDLMDDLKIHFEPQVKEKNLVLNIFQDYTSEDVLYGDMERLKQIFFNLIGNAIKFSEQGQISINISCTENLAEEKHYLFSVQDNGIGMSKAQSMRLFSAFSQADSSITRKYGGSGLGLAISKRIAKLMHGDIWVKTQKDKGSTFYFTAIFRSSLEGAEDLLEHDVVYDSQVDHNAEYLKQQSASSKLCSGNILLAEDNDINQLISVELLKNKGYSVDVANNGQEAVNMVKEKAYDLVLMDIQMPIMDGFTATEIIRELPKCSHLPIVAMSAHALEGDRMISLQHGMNDHLNKPITPTALYDTVAKWIHRRS